MPKVKPYKGKKKLPDRKLVSKAIKKYKISDSKDLRREYAGRGDTHALEGGKINPVNTQLYKSYKAKREQANLKTWEDRNRNIRGSKLSK